MCEEIAYTKEDRKRRLKRKPKKDIKKAIKAFCLCECMMGQREEVKLCPSTWCPLYPYRLGTNPFHKRTMTEEQKKEFTERMKTARNIKPSNDSNDITTTENNKD